MAEYRIEKVEELDPRQVAFTLQDGNKLKFHNIWLRDACRCSKCYNDTSKQRMFNSCDILDEIRPKAINNETNEVSIVWDGDGHVSKFSVRWIVLHSYNPKVIPNDEKIQNEKLVLKRTLWKAADLKELPTVDFNKIIASSPTSDNDAAIGDWCLKIWKHGFCLIDNVPVTPEDTERLCEKICYIRPTHYGGFWDFTGNMSVNDTAYSSVEIASHTDGTYWSDTPGLQLFHLLSHVGGSGGESSLVDAFYCAEILRKEHPEDFELLTRIPVPAHSAGEEDVCIQPDIPQPIFKLDTDNNLIQVRWNQSDRSTMDSWENPEDVPKFYRAIRNWYKIIADPKHEFFYQLKPGQCLIFDNWRCFHSRTEYTGERRLCGAYINRDDFVSRLKLLNLGREAVLNSL